MRYLVAVILLAIGVTLLGVAIAAYMQLRALAVLPAVPDLDDYPALMLVASDLWQPAINPQQPVPPKPTEIAQQTMQRIWLLGFSGLVVAVLGLLALALWPRPAKMAEDTST